MGTRAGVEHFVERHSLALFSPAQYAQAFRDAGLEPQTDPHGFFGYGLVTAEVG